MKNLVFIPTYWKDNGDKDEYVFDHPSLVSLKGTLGRTLQSFAKKKLPYDVFILPVPLKKNVEFKVKQIVKKFSKLNIYVLTKKRYLEIIKKVKRTDVSKEFKTQINLQDYSDVRNFGLIYAIINNYDNIMMIDDDEVIDGDYFNKAIKGIGVKINGKKLLGKTGYYIDKSGIYPMKQKDPKIRRLWLKGIYITKAINKAINNKERFNNTTIALGGSMVINKELFWHVPFDPYITRGEDIDYLMNAKHFGYQFLMDKELKVLHLPPKGFAPGWTKLRRDIYRFIYLKEKLKFLKISIKDTQPYPGFFLSKNLKYKIIKTNKNYAEDCIEKNKLSEAKEYIKNSTEILGAANEYAKQNAKKYFSFQKEWEKFAREI